MARPQTSHQALTHSTQAPVAFGNWALPKLTVELQDDELVSRQRALTALCDLVHDPERAYEAILNGKPYAKCNVLVARNVSF